VVIKYLGDIVMIEQACKGIIYGIKAKYFAGFWYERFSSYVPLVSFSPLGVAPALPRLMR